jgi:hypothetical protein
VERRVKEKREEGQTTHERHHKVIKKRSAEKMR